MMRSVILAACGGLLLAAGSAAAQDAKHGAAVFASNCAMCHSTQPGRNVMGPSLHGVVGRKAGTVPGFNYSQAMKNSGLVWTPAELDTYLTAPRAVVTGTHMSYPGLHSPKDRADLIAYLATQK